MSAIPVMVFADSYTNADGTKTMVDGTPLAKLQSAMDVIAQIPGLSIQEGYVYVEGRGIADVYVNNRRVTDLNELWQMSASAISCINVANTPSAEHLKESNAIVTIIMKQVNEGLHINEHLHLDLTNRFSTNNELTMGWKKNKVNLDGMLAWNEEQSNIYVQPIVYFYSNSQLNMGTITTSHINNKSRKITARTGVEYDINNKHKIALRYRYVGTITNNTDVTDAVNTTYIAENGAINLDKQLYTTNDEVHVQEPRHFHSIYAEYNGKVGCWKFNVGNTSNFTHIDNQEYANGNYNIYLRHEKYTRTYAKANVEIGNADISIGGEHLYDNMNVVYDQEASDDLDTYDINTDNTLAAYLTAAYKLKAWDFNAGVRYEHNDFSYLPYEDDFTDIFKIKNDQPMWSKGRRAKSGLMEVKNDMYIFTSNHFYLNLSAGVKIGKSHLQLTHSESSKSPDLSLTRITNDQLDYAEELVVKTERIYTNSLTWEYAWVNLSLTHNYYKDPVCNTSNARFAYNGKNYHALDFAINMSPTIRFWKPTLNVYLHKQWFEMDLARGHTKMNNPVVTIYQNNTFALPDDWMIRVNSTWHSGGYNRNIHYYSTNYKLDAAVLKEFPMQHITVELKGDNILYGSWEDITTYNIASSGKSDGRKVRIPRTVSLSFKYAF